MLLTGTPTPRGPVPGLLLTCFSGGLLWFASALLQDPSAIQAAHTSSPLAEDFNAMAFIGTKGKGKPVGGAQDRAGQGRAQQGTSSTSGLC